MGRGGSVGATRLKQPRMLNMLGPRKALRASSHASLLEIGIVLGAIWLAFIPESSYSFQK